MASIANEVFDWVNAQPWVPGQINFNVVRDDATLPWYGMTVAEADTVLMFLCNKEGGSATIEFVTYADERYGGYTIAETLRENIEKNIRGLLTTITVWNVGSTGTLSGDTPQGQIMSYTFEVTLAWEVN